VFSVGKIVKFNKNKPSSLTLSSKKATVAVGGIVSDVPTATA